MAKRKETWRWPIICATTTLVGLVIGVVGEGPADMLSAIILALPLALLVRKTRFLGPRPVADD